MNWELLIDLAVKLAVVISSGIVTMYVVPWLKEKRLYSTVVKMVQAAEKWSKTHEIDKKAWVIQQLVDAGVKVSPTVEALIESAVQELDIALACTDIPQKVNAEAEQTPTSEDFPGNVVEGFSNNT